MQDLDIELEYIKDCTLDACTEVEAITQFILEQAQENPDFSNGVAVDYLHAIGLLSFAYMFTRIAKAAQNQAGDFYQNKLLLAQYYCEKILPDLNTRFTRIRAGSDTIMQFSAEYFTQTRHIEHLKPNRLGPLLLGLFAFHDLFIQITLL